MKTRIVSKLCKTCNQSDNQTINPTELHRKFKNNLAKLVQEKRNEKLGKPPEIQENQNVNTQYKQEKNSYRKQLMLRKFKENLRPKIISKDINER